MLASTVQFSNNDQPPITPNQPVRVHWGRHPEGLIPSDTQQRARPVQSTNAAFHAEAVLTAQ
jgi:hypothetical protein